MWGRGRSRARWPDRDPSPVGDRRTSETNPLDDAVMVAEGLPPTVDGKLDDRRRTRTMPDEHDAMTHLLRCVTHAEMLRMPVYRELIEHELAPH